MTEAQFQAQIIQLAKLYGWKIYHTHDSRKSEAGFPDLCLVKDNRLIFWEVKSDKGKLSSEQWDWLTCLKKVAQAEVVQPHSWEYIQKELTR
ncbi:MAG: VRR-NUC domain-containing protein [Dehalococcoidales bacterium]|jgi:lipopolysaccharide export system protein LptC